MKGRFVVVCDGLYGIVEDEALAGDGGDKREGVAWAESKQRQMVPLIGWRAPRVGRVLAGLDPRAVT